MTRPAQQRRARLAAATHAAMVDAARNLFAQKGYFATTVEQIARQADVSPATVYATAGGKAGLMNALVSEWASSPVLRESSERLAELDDPAEIMRLVASASRTVRENHGAVMRVLLNTAPHDSELAGKLAGNNERYRNAMRAIAERLDALGALTGGPGTEEATDVLWFYFGYSGYFTLLDDNGWDLDRAQNWLLRQCCAALGIDLGVPR